MERIRWARQVDILKSSIIGSQALWIVEKEIQAEEGSEDDRLIIASPQVVGGEWIIVWGGRQNTIDWGVKNDVKIRYVICIS